MCRQGRAQDDRGVSHKPATVLRNSREFQVRAADELDLLPDGSAIAEMLADYSVMRDQARICRV
ncbi:hypothetical protein F9K78_20225 [Brucella pseudintermedia]|nr:hypothetical protein F9K78_20225 [Brucella pseudintermedia]